MRQIAEHVVNPANDKLSIFVMDGPSHGGACHKYMVGGGAADPVLIKFQNGPIGVDGNGVNGLTHEVLLAILADRLRGFQSGPYACDENAQALAHIEGAQAVLQARTKARMARGVEGTHTV